MTFAANACLFTDPDGNLRKCVLGKYFEKRVEGGEILIESHAHVKL